MHCRIFTLSYTRSTETICLKLSAYSSLISLLYLKGSQAPFLQVKVSVVNSAGGSSCWNHETDIFYGNYAGDNTCCIYPGFEVVLSVTGMLVYFSVAITHGTVSVAIMQLEVSVANMWVTIFIVIMQVGVTLCCNYAGGIFCSGLCT